MAWTLQPPTFRTFPFAGVGLELFGPVARGVAGSKIYKRCTCLWNSWDWPMRIVTPGDSRPVSEPAPLVHWLDYTVTWKNFDITASPLNQLHIRPTFNGCFTITIFLWICVIKAPPAPPSGCRLKHRLIPWPLFMSGRWRQGGVWNGLSYQGYYTGRR